MAMAMDTTATTAIATATATTTTRYDEEVGRLWAHFTELAERADRERKQTPDGRPFAETSAALDLLSGELDRVEALMSAWRPSRLADCVPWNAKGR